MAWLYHKGGSHNGILSPLCPCSNIWEILPSEVQQATTKVKFKNCVKPMSQLT